MRFILEIWRLLVKIPYVLVEHWPGYIWTRLHLPDWNCKQIMRECVYCILLQTPTHPPLLNLALTGKFYDRTLFCWPGGWCSELSQSCNAVDSWCNEMKMLIKGTSTPDSARPLSNTMLTRKSWSWFFKNFSVLWNYVHRVDILPIPRNVFAIIQNVRSNLIKYLHTSRN